jgi:hypothetical protein
MKRSLLAVAAAAAILVVGSGCDPVVFNSIEQDWSGGAGSPPSAAVGGGATGERSALAMRGSDVPAGSVFMVEPDPESLVLIMASAPQECADALNPPACEDAPAWELILSIPPELNRPGAIDLEDPRIGFHNEIRLDKKCGGGYGYGSGYWGTLTILSLDETSVSFTLSGATATSDLSFDGDYVAARCGPAPVTPPPTPVVAQLGSGLSGNPSSGTGPSANPDALYIFGGTSPGTCEEPVPVLDCPTDRQFVFSLPESLRVPGVISLDDPAIDAIYTSAATSCGTAKFKSGTLEITSIDASHIAFAIAGTQYVGLNGVYEGSMCP